MLGLLLNKVDLSSPFLNLAGHNSDPCVIAKASHG